MASSPDYALKFFMVRSGEIILSLFLPYRSFEKCVFHAVLVGTGSGNGAQKTRAILVRDRPGLVNDWGNQWRIFVTY